MHKEVKIMRILLLVVLLLAGCSQSPDIEAIKARFENSPEKYELLGSMAKEDFQGSRCFTVGLDHIGGFWEYDEKWTQNNNYEEKLSLDQVLEKLAISSQRYEKYKKLFSETGTERTTFCSVENKEWVRLLAYRSGLAVSGCSLDIVKKTSTPKSVGKRGEGDFVEITPLKNEWYIEFDCT
jgi:hypothetical protein